MKILRSRHILALAVLLAASTGRLSADPILLLTISDLTGDPGTNVGWGGSIQNNTSDWIEITSSQFCAPAPFPLTPAFTCTMPTTGTYTDIVASNDPVISPGGTYSSDFDPVGLASGIGYFSIDPSMDPNAGLSDVGAIVITFDAYSDDPNSCSSCQIFDPEPVPFDAEASVTVVPEPATYLFAAPTLLGLVLLARRARKVRAGTEAR